MLSVLGSPQAGTSQGQSMGRGGASSETRDWLSGHVRPGLGGQAGSGCQEPWRKVLGSQGDPGRSTGPSGLLPWVTVGLRTQGSGD